MAQDKITELLPEVKPKSSFVGMTFYGGTGVNVWAAPETVTKGNTEQELRLHLTPDCPIVIGRQQGGEIEYLDPHYAPTRLVPSTCQTLLNTKGNDRDVSRGHFMLKSSPSGIVLVNGVPGRDGAIRPPRNGTILLEPVHRWLDKKEEYLVSSGSSAKICLPNGTVILLVAE